MQGDRFTQQQSTVPQGDYFDKPEPQNAEIIGAWEWTNFQGFLEENFWNQFRGYKVFLRFSISALLSLFMCDKSFSNWLPYGKDLLWDLANFVPLWLIRFS